ncbi:phosphatase [Candidatus Woesearchaeota archaeon]|nr:MAG: phosphatase [Candidatus Woesearchaeota archaeon]
MLKVDLHMHTTISGDAHSTYKEYIDKALENNMEIIGFSEHGYGMPASYLTDYCISNYRRMPKEINGLKIIYGVEANIMDLDGGLDLPDERLAKLDYVIASIHTPKNYDGTVENNTTAMINAIRSKKMNIISHPYAPYGLANFEEVYEEACKNDVLLELNISYLKKEFDYDHISLIKKMIEIVKKHDKKLIVNTDSHNLWELGDDSELEKYKDELGLTNDMIINNYPDELLEFLGVER